MKFFKKEKQMPVNINPFPEIERKRILRGYYIPAVINNGGSHFFINLQVFEDGLIDCWDMVDLNLFREKLDIGWVTPTIPPGTEISIHHLGAWVVTDGRWLFNKETFYDHVLTVMKELNPEMTNLYNCYGRTTKKVGKINVSIFGLANGKPYKTKDPTQIISEKYPGDSFHAFVKNTETEYHLANIDIFSDSSIRVSSIENPKNYTIDEFNNHISLGNITSEVPEGFQVVVYGLGKFTIGECLYSEDIQQKALEIDDIVAQLQGEKTSSQICEEIYMKYCNTPTIALRDSLKFAYEKIPEHLRTYVLGDMDVKDIPIRMIIYGDKEIENWSHYYIAKEEGSKLPHIDVLKPVDENE